MSTEDQQKLENEVTVILHSAATTKFTEKLKLAVEMNTLGVRRMLDMAKRCKKLVSVVHISTCYVAADKPNTHIEDRIYPTRYTPYEIIERVRDLSVDEAEKFMEEVIYPYPNTYSFTKALGEQIVAHERGNLPLCILRPSIVTASWMEPLPGWIDVMFGPAGLFLATGMGALKLMIGKVRNVTDMVPVDTVCNGILAAAWRNVKLSKEAPDFPANMPIYHIATSTANPVTWMTSQFIVPSYFCLHRPKRNFGWPGYATMISSRPLFVAGKYLVHYLPAAIVDSLRLLQGKKAFMLKAAMKLDRAMEALGHFTLNEWFFSNNTTNAMMADLNETDKRVYNIDVKDLDWDTYFIVFLHGIRKYLLKEDSAEPIKQGEKRVSEQVGWFQSIMNYVRSYLVIISLGCLLYFFRQNFWIFQLRAKQMKRYLQNMAKNVSTRALTNTA
jgi:fatty acyl-CoA reductase